MQVRDAREDEVPRLREIYNHYVEHTHITFDTAPQSLAARRRWFRGFEGDGPHRLLVALRGHVLLGFASSGVFRAKPAYARSVETSIYLAPDCEGAGAGTLLYSHLLALLEAEPSVHRAYGGVALPNEASIALHLKCGFKNVATFSEVGFKFGRYWDVAWFERAV